MNRYELNGALLGNGGNDSRSFAATSVTALATAAVVAFALRMASTDAIAVANGSAAGNIIYAASSHATAAASAVAAPVIPVTKFASGSALGAANGSGPAWVAFVAGGSASGTSVASSAADVVAGTFVGSSARGEALTSVAAFKVIPASGSGSGIATAQAVAGQGAFVSSHAYAYALAGSIYATEFGNWSIDRLMILPSELRNMEIQA